MKGRRGEFPSSDRVVIKTHTGGILFDTHTDGWMCQHVRSDGYATLTLTRLERPYVPRHAKPRDE